MEENSVDYGLANYYYRNEPYVRPNVQTSTSNTQAVTPVIPAVGAPSIQTGVMDKIKSWWGGQNSGSGTADPNAPLMSRGIANTLGLGNLGLGLAGYLENRKTAGLQREALRNDIATAKEHRANRQALGNSWNNAWNS